MSRLRRASAAVEFALLVPALAATLGAVVDLGWFLWIHNVAEQAAREGARAGSRVTKASDGEGPAEEGDIEAKASAQANYVLGHTWQICQSYGCTVTSTWAEDGETAVDMLRVDVAVAVRPLVGLVPSARNGVVGTFTVVTLRQD
jgi:Flp pilus assembly protein TadG